MESDIFSPLIYTIRCHQRATAMESYEELFSLAKRLSAAAAAGEADDIAGPLNAIDKAVDQVKRSFSGSWLGYHSRVYYADLEPAPPRANFSQEWGLKDLSITSLGSRGDWQEFDPQEVKEYIGRLAENPDLEPARAAAVKARAIFSDVKSDVMSILESELEDRQDPFLTKLKSELDQLEPASKFEIAQYWSPKGQIMTRDTLALGQGVTLPPHLDVLSDVAAIRNAFVICKTAADISTKAGSHLERKARKKVASDRVGTNVFIGHGRSLIWRELKDFIQDRLSLPWDEFNRVPVAGVTNIARLAQMLDAAAIALLVLTAEDQMEDGETQARLNVVHEAGLFQGRLGFTKAIILLEEGCTEFSNIQGLGQIRFPKGNISASFEEIRRVLEREGLLGDN
jgi:predicted nucleotide-binding protein